jgi:protein-S-isoprenylcysteine O-methyltransferase Ste14
VFAFFWWLWLWYVPFSLLGQPKAIAGEPLALGLGLALAAVGAVITGSCALEFALRGRGTPAPFDPPRRLVTGALYRRVRNPMYLGFSLLILGEAALLRAPALLGELAVFLALAHGFVILYEEPTLRRTFGADYDAYRASVPRWVPRLHA